MKKSAPNPFLLLAWILLGGTFLIAAFWMAVALVGLLFGTSPWWHPVVAFVAGAVAFSFFVHTNARLSGDRS